MFSVCEKVALLHRNGISSLNVTNLSSVITQLLYPSLFPCYQLNEQLIVVMFGSMAVGKGKEVLWTEN